MKWLIPASIGGLVLVLGILFARAQKATALAAETQARSANAAQKAAQAKAGSMAAAPDHPIRNSDQQAAAADVAPVVPGTTKNKPEVPAGAAGRPSVGERQSTDRVNNSEPEPDTGAGTMTQFMEAVRLAVPKASIQAVKVKDSVMLLGHVASQGDVRKISEIAALHFATVLNYLEVPGQPSLAGDASIPVAVDLQNDKAAQEYRQHEAQCQALANAYRQQQTTIPQDAKTLEQLKGELEGAVHAAFHARQTWQRSQGAQLRTRLEQIERRISERGQTSSEIIQRRVEELLHPEKQWDQKDDVATRQATVLPKDIEPIGKNVPIRSGNGSLPTEFSAENTGDPRRRLLDAEAAIAAAETAVLEADAQLTGFKNQLRVQRQAYDANLIDITVVMALETDVERSSATLKGARARLESARRQERLERGTLASQVKFLELDLADAKLRLQHADDELSAIASPFGDKHPKYISQQQAHRLAHGLAASQCKRAEMLVELYRKALSDTAAPDDKAHPAVNPAEPAAVEKPDAPQAGGTEPQSDEKAISNKTSDARSTDQGAIGDITDGKVTEVPIGDFSFSNVAAAPGMIMHVDFKLSANVTSTQATSFDSQIKLDQARVRAAVNKIVRNASLEELNDPKLATIKRLIREDINRLLHKNEVQEVVITDVRTMQQ